MRVGREIRTDRVSYSCWPDIDTGSSESSSGMYISRHCPDPHIISPPNTTLIGQTRPTTLTIFTPSLYKQNDMTPA